MPRPGRIARALAVACLVAAAPLSGVAARREATAVVRIDMRGPIAAGWFDPQTERVGLRGGSAPLSWASTVEAEDPDHDGVYRVLVRFDVVPSREAFVAYKFKVDGTDNPNDGWEDGPNRALLLARSRAVVTRAFDAGGPEFPRTLHGAIRVHPDFASKFVSPRAITVLLPPGYERDRARRYPVLYLHDGQNLFDARTAHGGEWRVDESAGALVRAGRMEPAIVVGIASVPSDRIFDYTPTVVTDRRADPPVRIGGRADAYGRFLVEEVKPFVDATYRTRPDAASTGLGGSSLGGLVTMYLGLKYPAVFSRLLVVSPSVWWDERTIAAMVASLEHKTPQRIWLDIGTREGDEAVADARLLRDALVAKGWRLGRDLVYVEASGAGHDESAWAARAPAMLRFAFPPRRSRRSV